MQVDTLSGPITLTPPRGPIAKKFNTFAYLGEPESGIFRFREMWMVGDVSTHKCVVGGSLVRSGDALIPIQKLGPSNLQPDQAVPRNIPVLSRFGPETAKAFYYGGIKPTRKITLKNGQELEGTLVHPILVQTPSGSQWKRIGDLALGDQVALRVEHPDPVESSDEGYLLGLLIGDGHISKRQVSITNMDKEVDAFLMALPYPLGVRKAEYKHNSGQADLYRLSYRAAYKTSALTYLSKEYGLKEGGASQKTTPSWVMEGSLSAKRGFLQGLFDSDGCADKRGAVRYATNSEQLAREVQTLLLMFGVVTNLTKRKASWNLEAYGKWANRFFESVGFRVQRKQERQALLKNGRGYVPLIGVGGLLKQHIREIAGKTKHVWHKYNSYFSGYVNPSVDMVRRILEEFPGKSSTSSILYDLTDPNICWVQVESFADGEAEVFDLTVPSVQEFTANGFVVHNTSAMVWSLIMSAQNYPKGRICVLRDTYENLKDSTIPTILKICASLLESGEWIWVPSEETIRCQNGTVIRFFGLDKADNRLWGSEWFRAFIDQGERINEQQLQTLHTRMRWRAWHKKTGKRGATFIKITANWDKGYGWFVDRVKRKGKSTEEEPDFFETKIEVKRKNGRIVHGYALLIEARIEESEEIEQEYYEHLAFAGEVGEVAAGGGYADQKGLIFRDADDYFSVPKDMQDWSRLVCYMSLDWGIFHPCAAIFWAHDPATGRSVGRREYVYAGRSAENASQYIAVILQEIYNLGCRTFYSSADPSMWDRESTGKSAADTFIQTFMRLPFPMSFVPAVKNRAGSITRGISDMKHMIENGQVWIDENECPELTRMFRRITYEDVLKDTYGIVDVFDAARYGCMNLRNGLELDKADEEKEEIEERRKREQEQAHLSANPFDNPEYLKAIYEGIELRSPKRKAQEKDNDQFELEMEEDSYAQVGYGW